MYIIELFFKLKERIKNKKAVIMPSEPMFLENENEIDEKCEHILSPVDSTNTVLACVKCGYLIHCKTDDLKKKNFFENPVLDNDFENDNK